VDVKLFPPSGVVSASLLLRVAKGSEARSPESNREAAASTELISPNVVVVEWWQRAYSEFYKGFQFSAPIGKLATNAIPGHAECLRDAFDRPR
jgi:hypothetical protein